MFQNTSIDGTSYSWSFQGGFPATSNQVNPRVHFPVSGSYQVQLIAYGPATSDTVQQLVDVVVNVPSSAQFSINADTLYLPNAVLNCTNASVNANGYNWDFGDGTQSQDENPWHSYQSSGIYELKLTAVNDACPDDSMSRFIRVIDVAGIADQDDLKLMVYPNPASDHLMIDSEKPKGIIYLTDYLGRTVLTKQVDSYLTDLQIRDLAGGMYQLIYQVEGKTSVRSIIKR